MILNILTMKNLNLKYSNKNIMLNSTIFMLKTLELYEGYVFASVYPKELNLLSKLKFRIVMAI